MGKLKEADGFWDSRYEAGAELGPIGLVRFVRRKVCAVKCALRGGTGYFVLIKQSAPPFSIP